MPRIKRQVRIYIDCAKGENDATFPPIHFDKYKGRTYFVI